MYLKSVCFFGASLALRGQMRVKYFCIFSILSDSNGQCLSNAKNQASLPCLCAEIDARKHLYFFKKGGYTLGAKCKTKSSLFIAPQCVQSPNSPLNPIDLKSNRDNL
jgi:hypothetical protein